LVGILLHGAEQLVDLAAETVEVELSVPGA
jgi:hypothetical protein